MMICPWIRMALNDAYYSAWRNANLLKNVLHPCEVTLALRKAVIYIDSALVIGDVAEFGCWTGRSSRKIYSQLVRNNPARTLHLFDSFEGLPEPTAHQDTQSAQVKLGLWSRGTFSGPSARSIARACPKAIIHKGWYSVTVPSLDASIKFAMIHLDCDLYSSTIDALSPLFQRGQVSKGAVLLFDDWSCNQADNSLGERAAWRTLVKQFGIEYEDDGSYGWTQKRLIVHSYTNNLDLCGEGKEK